MSLATNLYYVEENYIQERLRAMADNQKSRGGCNFEEFLILCGAEGFEPIERRLGVAPPEAFRPNAARPLPVIRSMTGFPKRAIYLKSKCRSARPVR